MEKIYTRRIEIDFEKRDTESGLIPCSISSETPVPRDYGYEVLDHSPDSIDMSRAKEGLPLLSFHNHKTLIGRVINIHLQDKKLKGYLRRGNTTEAKEVWQDIESGILTDLSVGYALQSNGVKEGKETYRFKKWLPFEVSAVAIGADPQAGINRNFNFMNGGFSMENINNNSDVKVENRRLFEIKEITAIASKFGSNPKIREAADRAISEGTDLETFRQFVLSQMHAKPMSNMDSEPLLNSRELNNYSLVRGLAALISGDWSQAGYEREISQHLSRQRKKDTGGLMVPFQAFEKRAVSKSGTGTHLIGTEYFGSNFIELLRNRAMILMLGAKSLTNLVGDVVIPKATGGATAYWIGEGSNATESTPTFGSVSLVPKTVAGLCKASRKMLIQTDSPGIEEILRSDLTATIGLAIDQACINGKGTNNEPLGILNATGIGDVAGGTNGAAPTYDHVLELESDVATSNADIGSLAYLTNSKVRKKLKATQRFTSTDTPVWQDGSEAGLGTVNGYKAGSSNAVPSNLTKGSSSGVCSAIIFGNFAEILLGVWGQGLEIVPDPYTDFKSGAVWLRAMADIDVALRHPESFSCMFALPPK